MSTYKLFRKEYDEQPFVDIQTSGIREHVYYTGSTLDGYENINTIENVYLYSQYCDGYDYKLKRAIIQNIMYDITGTGLTNWMDLTTEERRICCEMFLVPHQLRDEFYTNTQQTELGIIFNNNSVDSRTNRCWIAQSEVFNRLDHATAVEISNDVIFESNLRYAYVQIGREYTLKGDPEGLYDYLLNTIGTSYENNGFRSYTPTELYGFDNMIDFSNYLVDILEYGKIKIKYD